MAAVVPHFGEEPPLTTGGRSGHDFLHPMQSAVVYCQNHQISQGGIGAETTPRALASEMIRLQDQGCSNVEAVSPGHHLPGFLEALAIAVEQGLTLPVVYNTNGYESLEALELLDGIVDVYLPDLKYADSNAALEYSDAADYVERARSGGLRMHAQVGNLVVDMHGRAVRGLILEAFSFFRRTHPEQRRPSDGSRANCRVPLRFRSWHNTHRFIEAGNSSP